MTGHARTLALAGMLATCLAWTDPTGSTSLFRCATEGEQIVYTDTPAQLEQCAPITTSGAVTSLATTPSNPTAPGQPPEMPPPVSPSPQPAPSSEGAATTLVGAPASVATESLPCPVGINPLNPFTNPPCPH